MKEGSNRFVVDTKTIFAKYFALFLFLFISYSFAQAQQITFAEARATAENLSLDVQIALRQIELSKAQIKEAGDLSNPTFSVATAKQTARLSSGLSIPIPLFGQRSTVIKAAKADAYVETFAAETKRQEALWNATVAWINLWEAQERSRQLNEAADDAERLLGIAQKRFEAGLAPNLEVLRAKAERAKAAAEAAQAHLAVRAAAAQLLPWISLEPGTEIEAVGNADFPTELPEIDKLIFDLPCHPALMRDHAQMMAEEARVKMEKRQRWPVINADITVNQFDPTQPGVDIIGGLSFEIPLFSLRSGAIARARAQREVAAAEAAADAQHLSADLQDTYRRAEGAAKRAQALATDVVPAMEAASQMAEQGYRIGRMDLFQLLDTQKSLIESKLEQIEATAEWVRACADLERASGQKLEGDTHYAQ